MVLGGLTQSGFYDLKSIYRYGAGNYFDIVNIHPFTNPLREGHLDEIIRLYKNIKKLLARHNDDKKIWFTEIGCPGVRKPTKENGWWEGKSPTYAQQAKFVKEIYTKIIELEDVEKIFWAFFRDCNNHFNSGVDSFGLVRWGYSKKKSFSFYKWCVRRWRSPK